MNGQDLKFFNKRGKPLNLEYVEPSASGALTATFNYLSDPTTTTPTNGFMSLLNLGSNLIYLNSTDQSGFSIVPWFNSVVTALAQGTKVILTFTYYPAQTLVCVISSASISSGVITLTSSQTLGSPFISGGTPVYCETKYENLSGGYYRGFLLFDEVSAGLYENEQLFIVQQFKDTSSGQIFLGFPHTGATGSPNSPLWRTRWENSTYGNVNVEEIIFTYQIVENDPDLNGSPSILNFQNIALPIIQNSSDTYVNGYIQTPESQTPSRALQINIGLNSGEVASNVYERKLILEDITYGIDSPYKIAEILFYGQIIGEDSRLDVLTQNLGRAFFGTDSVILRNHDPNNILPNYVEINEKRKELMVAGEDIFPYIGSYKGLIGALKFFGYQDLRIKEYWLNLNFEKIKLQPLQQNQDFLDNYGNTPFPNQQSLIADVFDNQNNGKYRLIQTYGPNEEGEYVLDISGEETLVPSRTYKKTALFGLYYDIVRMNGDIDPYGYPITQETFAFTQEEVLLKLFALMQRLKESYLPTNARIVDITGEGIYFNIYNTKEWTDFLDRSDVESGNNFDFFPNPDFGFIEDLRAFGIRQDPYGIQAPMNYNDVIDINVTVAGPSGNVFRFSESTGIQTSTFQSPGNNPTLNLNLGKTYNFNLLTPGYDFILTTQSNLTPGDPLGVVNNGASGGTVTIEVNPQEQTTLFYYSSVNTSLLNGQITLSPSPISDFGNTVPPLFNNQNYTGSQNSSMQTAIANFYYFKENGQLKFLGDSNQDPIQFVDPSVGGPYVNPIGMPLILELDVDKWLWDEMGQSWDSMRLPNFEVGQTVNVKTYQEPGASGATGGGSAVVESIDYVLQTCDLTLLPSSIPFPDMPFAYLTSIEEEYQLMTWQNIDFSAYTEIEWIIEKSSTQPGTGYFYSFRGNILDYNKLSHFLPFTGQYDVTCLIYDSFNFVNRKIKKTAVTVSPKEISLDAWTRYRENEIYIWEQTTRDWDSYQSMWVYPAEGKTQNEVEREIPSEILNFAVYGNNANQGQNLQVLAEIPPVGASGNFTLNQEILNVTAAYCNFISGSQFGFLNIFTSSPHNYTNGSGVYLSGFMPEINYEWNIIIPPGSTGVSFQIPYVLDPTTAGVGLTGGPGSISGATAYFVDPTYWPNQTVTGNGSITVSINNRVVGATSSGSNLQASVNSIVQEINSFITQPDYFAQTFSPNAIPATVNLVADTSSGNIGNGNSFDVSVTGSLQLVSSDSVLSGGVTGYSSFVNWNPLTGGFPVESLKYYGTKNLTWDTFNDSIWDEAYAHGWYDFEYQSGWLGGFEIHSIGIGDNVKISTGNETFPFPVGVTFNSSGTLTLNDVANQLNSSSDPNITNFYYRVMPSSFGNDQPTIGPTQTQFTSTSFPTFSITSPIPPTVLAPC